MVGYGHIVEMVTEEECDAERGTNKSVCVSGTEFHLPEFPLLCAQCKFPESN